MTETRILRLYISINTIKYLIRRPKQFPYYLLRYLRESLDYIQFISKLLNVKEDIIRKALPEKLSWRNLELAFKKSINPSSGEMPLSFEESMAVYLSVRLLKPKIVIETGVSAGRSSAFILQALDDNGFGHLYSIDPDPHCGYAIPNLLKKHWTFISKKSSEVLPSLLNRVRKVDIFLHDSLHTYKNMMYEFETVWPYIARRGILLSDDITFNTAFQDFCQKHYLHPVYLGKGFAGVRKL